MWRKAFSGDNNMYVGRIVVIGNNREGKLVAMYRVSSRSFPNRKSIQIGETIAIIPREGFGNDIYRNPYITYNCLRTTPRYAVAANGTQTDPIIEKLASGMNVRDAMTAALFSLDYEHDHLNTPRIAAVVDRENRIGALGIVRHDALLVRIFTHGAGEAYYLATYEHNYPDEKFRDDGFNTGTAEEGCDYILGKGIFASMELPVSAACAIESENGFAVAHKTIR
jgi:IMP cyclohydrolase